MLNEFSRVEVVQPANNALEFIYLFVQETCYGRQVKNFAFWMITSRSLIAGLPGIEAAILLNTRNDENDRQTNIKRNKIRSVNFEMTMQRYRAYRSRQSFVLALIYLATTIVVLGIGTLFGAP